MRELVQVVLYSNIVEISHKKEVGKLKKLLDQDVSGIEVTKIILASIAVAGFVVVVVTLPGLPMVLAPFIRRKKYTDRQVYNAYRSLDRSGYVKSSRLKDGRRKILITNKGRKKLSTINLDSIAVPKPRRWDGKWHFVIFDIPKHRAKIRDEFRFKLKDLGFRQYQKSIWVYPYPCREEIKEIASFFAIRSYVDVFEVTRFSGERGMRVLFKKECSR